MNIKIIKEREIKGEARELLIEVDEELLDIYRSETGEDDFDQDSFNEWLQNLLEHAIEGEDWIDN